MKASTRRKLKGITAGIGVGLMVLAFACVFVVERLLNGLHVGADACRAMLADRLPDRVASPTPEASTRRATPDELDDVEASLQDLSKRAA